MLTLRILFAVTLLVGVSRADPLAFGHGLTCPCPLCRSPSTDNVPLSGQAGHVVADSNAAENGSADPCTWITDPPLTSPREEYVNYFVGLDFITETVVPDLSFAFNFEPFPLLNPENNLVSQGATGALSELQLQREIALAVEDAFRDLDTGDERTTARIGIYPEKAPEALEGRRLNVAMGQSACPTFRLLGQAKQDSFDSNFAQDAHAAVSYLDDIDGMGNGFVEYDTLDKVLNAIAGTTAHEIGHVFGASHVPTTAEVVPQKLLATESTGMPTSDRFTVRRFSADNPSSTSNAETLLRNVGTVVIGDVNFDDVIDAADAAIMFSNWGSADRLFQEGDVDNDHLVDAADVSFLFQNWTSSGPLMAPEPRLERSPGGWSSMDSGNASGFLDSLGGFRAPTAVPEPSRYGMGCLFAIGLCGRCRKRRILTLRRQVSLA